MTNEITKDLAPLHKWAKAAARGETDKIPYIDITDLINEMVELRAKVESLTADAERYRWLRDEHVGDDPELINLEPAKRSGLDAAIDAAMAKEKA